MNSNGVLITFSMSSARNKRCSIKLECR